MKREKINTTILLLFLACGTAWASNQTVIRIISNPYYFANGQWKQLVSNNVFCHPGPRDCVYQTPDGIQQLYATPNFATPLGRD